MMAFLDNVEDAETADKDNIQKITKTNATMVALCKQLEDIHVEQQTLINELTSILAKTSHIKIPIAGDKDCTMLF